MIPSVSSQSNEIIPICIRPMTTATELQSGMNLPSPKKQSKGTPDKDLNKSKSRGSVDEFKLGTKIDLLVKANEKNDSVQLD